MEGIRPSLLKLRLKNMIKSEWLHVRKRWEVLQCINTEYNTSEDLEIGLSYSECPHTAHYIYSVLRWLENKNIIKITNKPVTGWMSEKIGVKILNLEKFKKNYEKVKNEYEEIAIKTNTESCGLNLILEYKARSQTLQWFHVNGELINAYELKSERGAKIIELLWGKKQRITLEEGISQQWPRKCINLTGLMTLAKIVKVELVKTSIDNINRELAKKSAPIKIQRADGKANITIKNLTA